MSEIRYTCVIAAEDLIVGDLIEIAEVQLVVTGKSRTDTSIYVAVRGGDFDVYVYNPTDQLRVTRSVPDKSVDDSRFPHRCPRCAGPAYIGAFSVDCHSRCDLK